MTRVRGAFGRATATTASVVRRARPLGVIRSAIRITVFATIVAAAIPVGALTVSALYDQYGYHPARDAGTWARRPVSYALAPDCGTCHVPEAAASSTSGHAGIACQSCHGPLAVHTGAARPEDVPVEPPSDTICLACHEEVVGRPSRVGLIDATDHFGASSCLVCHGTHATTTTAAVVMPHPRAKLPACAVCHAPDGLDPAPAGHPEAEDAICLTCHRATVSPGSGGTR